MATLLWQDGASGFFQAGGHRLEYRTVGPEPAVAPTIVLLHEGLGCVSLWRDFPEALANATGCGVFLWSRVGYGHSDPAPPPWPLDYMTREAETCLPLALDAAGVERCILFGHSDGATIAAIYAGSVSDARVRGVVLVAPHFFTEPGGLASIAKTREGFQSGKLRDALARHHDDVDSLFNGWSGVWLDPEFARWNVEDALTYIRVPALAIQGKEDEYGTLAHVRALEAAAPAPVEVVVIENCRHAPHHERRPETLGAVSDFVERLLRMARAGAGAAP